MILKSEAIVVKSFDFRETSRIATFFSRDYGKVSGILKGIRKDPRKFGSSVDRFSVNDIVYYQYRNSDLHLISHCDMREYFHPVRQDMKKAMAASYILELINVLMPVEEANRGVYQLVIDFLKALEGEGDINQLVHIFQIKVLALTGFRPHLDTCLISKKKISGQALFSLKEGGLIDPEHKSRDPRAQAVSQGTISALLHIERSAWFNCLKLRLTELNKKELKYVLNNFLVFHLGRKLKSARLVGQGV